MSTKTDQMNSSNTIQLDNHLNDPLKKAELYLFSNLFRFEDKWIDI